MSLFSMNTELSTKKSNSEKYGELQKKVEDAIEKLDDVKKKIDDAKENGNKYYSSSGSEEFFKPFDEANNKAETIKQQLKSIKTEIEGKVNQLNQEIENLNTQIENEKRNQKK